MPVNQKSRILHRRGLLVDLPTLQGSEIGHVVDQRRLFIGNGELIAGAPEVGNTEIITEYTLISNPDALKYVYRSNTPIEAVTGPTANDPILRSYQQVLDDHVSVKSYGVVGDGITDDSQSFNRALEDLYTQSSIVSDGYRRILFVPAGEYILDASQIFLPPHCSLKGEGKDKTIIRMVNASQTSVVSTSDSDFQTDIQLGNNGADLPFNIHVEDLTLKHDADQDVIDLQRATDCTFVRVKFEGGWVSGISDSQLVDFDPLGTIHIHNNIKFINCDFIQGGNISKLSVESGTMNNIIFENCNFSNLFAGLLLDNQCDNVVIQSSIFDNIEQISLFLNPNSTGVKSLNNKYNLVGTSGNYPSGNPAIVLLGDNSSSLNDIFTLQPGVLSVVNQGDNNIILNPQQDLYLNNLSISTVSDLIALAPGQTNQATGISFDLTQSDTFFIDYALRRDGQVRTGRMFLSSNGSTSDLADLFSESGTTDITFATNIVGSTISITYTSSLGPPGEMKYQVKSWLNS